MTHTSEQARFCSRCGQPLKIAWNVQDQLERLSCQRCGLIHYDSPKVLVWCLAHCNERVLLCRRAIPPAVGLWNPPSGFVEAGESLEEAMVRELAEEAGVDLPTSSLSLYEVTSLPHMNQIYVGFRVELLNEPVLAPGPECSDARFFSEATLPAKELAFSDMLPMKPSAAFKLLRDRDFSIRLSTLRHAMIPKS